MIELFGTNEATSKHDENTIECVTAHNPSSFRVVRDEQFAELKVRFLQFLTENHLNLLKT